MFYMDFIKEKVKKYDILQTAQSMTMKRLINNIFFAWQVMRSLTLKSGYKVQIVPPAKWPCKLRNCLLFFGMKPDKVN